MAPPLLPCFALHCESNQTFASLFGESFSSWRTLLHSRSLSRSSFLPFFFSSPPAILHSTKKKEKKIAWKCTHTYFCAHLLCWTWGLEHNPFIYKKLQMNTGVVKQLNDTDLTASTGCHNFGGEKIVFCLVLETCFRCQPLAAIQVYLTL